MIERFLDQYRWLSNFWEVEIKYCGVIYPTVEHYYVAMKVNEPQKVNIEIDGEKQEIYMDVPQLREYISMIETPSKAKNFGKKELKERADWDDIKVSIMEWALNEKYKQEPFRTKLLETGDVYIQEGNTWNDTYWGVNIDTGEGKNVLGKLIMKIREQLKEEK
jgi:ribA/ribD-fused uncharacterized protein